MTQLLLTRSPTGAFVPCTEEEFEKASEFKPGMTVRANIIRFRNEKFLAKFFKLVKLGFDVWEPPTREHEGLPIQKNLDRFRKDLIIAAGYYDVVVDLRWNIRYEAHSIAFDKMNEETFEKLYSKIIDVLLQGVLKTYTRADVDEVIQRILDFA